MLSSVRHSKTYCYENDFTLPDVPSLLTVISDVIRALTVPQLNRSARSDLCCRYTGGILTPSLMGTYPHSSFSFLCQHPPRLQCEPSHLKQFRLLQRRPFFYVGKWSDRRETGRDHKRRKCELVFFGRGDREMWLFFIVHTWRFSYKLDQIYSLQGFSWCLKCNVMTRRAERIFQSGGLQLTKKKKKKGNRDVKASDAICTDVFWMGGFTEQSIPSASTPGQMWGESIITTQSCEERLLRKVEI